MDKWIKQYYISTIRGNFILLTVLFFLNSFSLITSLFSYVIYRQLPRQSRVTLMVLDQALELSVPSILFQDASSIEIKKPLCLIDSPSMGGYQSTDLLRWISGANIPHLHKQ